MVSLCRNRPEGFGPHSTIHPDLPTGCFLDAVVVPLPTWIFLGFLVASLPWHINPPRRRRASSILKPTKPIEAERIHTLQDDMPPRPALHTRILIALYYILVATMAALVSIEIAQLSNANIGIGLLPFSYVGFVAVLANRLRWKTRMARLENMVFWVLLGTALTLKVAAQVIESDKRAGEDDGSRGAYAAFDGIALASVMVGFSFALGVLEFADWPELGPVT